jgi:hypothetical protein
MRHAPLNWAVWLGLLVSVVYCLFEIFDNVAVRADQFNLRYTDNFGSLIASFLILLAVTPL